MLANSNMAARSLIYDVVFFDNVRLTAFNATKQHCSKGHTMLNIEDFSILYLSVSESSSGTLGTKNDCPSTIKKLYNPCSF